MRDTVFLALLTVLFASRAAAQTVTVKKDVNLRAKATTASAVIELLKSGATLTLLDSTKQSGFYHVKTTDGKQGWVWARNIAVANASSTVTPQSGTSAQCEDSLWTHVYNPQRLIVKQKCIAVTGTIVDATNGRQRDGVRHEADGDTHGWLDVDPQFKNLLNAGTER